MMMQVGPTTVPPSMTQRSWRVQRWVLARWKSEIKELGVRLIEVGVITIVEVIEGMLSLLNALRRGLRWGEEEGMMT